MAYINLSLANKLARANQIITDIGPSGFLNIYDNNAFSSPPSPDNTISGAILVSMPLSAIAGVASTFVIGMNVTSYGSGAPADGIFGMSGTTGTGTFFQFDGSIVNGSLQTNIGYNVSAGLYSVNPIDLDAEPITGGGLVGGMVNLAMLAQITFNPITPTNAIASGVANFARFTDANGKGIVDVDVSVPNPFSNTVPSLQISSTTIFSGQPVQVISAVINES